MQLVLKENQRRFRHKLEPLQWKAYLDKARKWKQECEARTCQHCGTLKTYSKSYYCSTCGAAWPVDSWRCYRCGLGGRPEIVQLCGCNLPPTDEMLVTMIRRLAGINGPSVNTRTEWDDWNRGKNGPRACGPANWDNAVGAWEGDDP